MSQLINMEICALILSCFIRENYQHHEKVPVDVIDIMVQYYDLLIYVPIRKKAIQKLHRINVALKWAPAVLPLFCTK